MVRWFLRSLWWFMTGFILFFSGMTAVSVFAKVEALGVAYGSGLPWIYLVAPFWVLLSLFQFKKKRKPEYDWKLD